MGEEGRKLQRLLQVLTPSLDHSRVVHQLRKAENLPLAIPYLKSVQKENLSVVNEALNELFSENSDNYTTFKCWLKKLISNKSKRLSLIDKMSKKSLLPKSVPWKILDVNVTGNNIY